MLFCLERLRRLLYNSVNKNVLIHGNTASNTKPTQHKNDNLYKPLFQHENYNNGAGGYLGVGGGALYYVPGDKIVLQTRFALSLE